jgi:serine/threonine-protein kinase RsbW
VVPDDVSAVELEFPAVRASAVRARHAVRRVAEGAVADLYAVELAVAEAVANVILHAYRGRDGAQAVFRVEVGVERDHLCVVVADDGLGMAPRPDSPGLGLGLALIADATDALEIEERERGTRVVMRFRLTR